MTDPDEQSPRESPAEPETALSVAADPVRLVRAEPGLRVETSATAPLAADPQRSWSGLAPAAITIDRARAGSLDNDDVRIHPDALLAQAAEAERSGNRQLAGTLRLAAELTVLPERELLSVYELLRPGRASLDAMNEAVRLLDRLGLPAAAALVREASAWYVTRGLVGRG